MRIKEKCDREEREEFELMEHGFKKPEKEEERTGRRMGKRDNQEYSVWDSRRIHFREEAVSSQE